MGSSRHEWLFLVSWLNRKVGFFGDIHEELPIAKATVSQHLKELKDAGLIQGEIENAQGAILY